MEEDKVSAGSGRAKGPPRCPRGCDGAERVHREALGLLPDMCEVVQIRLAGQGRKRELPSWVAATATTAGCRGRYIVPRRKSRQNVVHTKVVLGLRYPVPLSMLRCSVQLLVSRFFAGHKCLLSTGCFSCCFSCCCCFCFCCCCGCRSGKPFAGVI